MHSYNFFMAALIFFSFIQPLEARSKIKVNGGKPFLIVTREDDNGLFSAFNTVIGALVAYERGEYSGLTVRFQSQSYFDPTRGPNWWDYFFDSILIGTKKGVPTEVLEGVKASDWAWEVQRSINTRKRDHDLIQRYIHVRAHINRKIETFIKNNFSNNFIIGVHYRGTDKMRLESPHISYEKMAECIRNVINECRPQHKEKYKIFVATDEQGFLNYIRSKFHCPVINTDARRSQNGMPTHFSNCYMSNYQKGEDAVLDCLLLSRSNILIRTESNLSFVASRFNLNLPVLLVQ